MRRINGQGPVFYQFEQWAGSDRLVHGVFTRLGGVSRAPWDSLNLGGTVGDNQAAVREMHRQVGDLQLDGEGIATRGLLVRHLVLPEGIAGTEAIVRFLAEEVSANTYINIMGQYRPAWHIRERNVAPLNRPVTRQEVEEAAAIARQAGLRLDERASRILRWL